MYIFFILRNSLESLESEGFPVAALAKKTSTTANGKKQKPSDPLEPLSSEDLDPVVSSNSKKSYLFWVK
jgi:hypothetical protein